MIPSRISAPVCGKTFKGLLYQVNEALSWVSRQSTSAKVAGQLSDNKLKSVNDLPLPTFPESGNKWIMLWRSLFPKNDNHQLWEKIARSSPQKVYRVATPFLSHAVVFSSDPEHAAAMFRNEGEMPERPAEDIAWLMKKHGFGTGLVIDNWEKWHTLRSKSNKQIVPRKVLEFTPLIHEVAGDVVKYFREHRGVSNYVDDVLKPLVDWSFEGMGIFILGERLNLFMDPSARMKRFQKAGASFVEGFGSLFSGIPLYRLVPTPSSVRFVDAAHQLEEITKELVEEKIAKLSKSDDVDEVPSGFLEQWLMSDDFSKEDIAVLMRDFLAAGIDTTSITATNMLFELAKNPLVQEKLKEEVLSVVGEHGVPTVQDLQKLPYAKSIITETLRLHPIVSINVRTIPKDMSLDDYHIPKELGLAQITTVCLEIPQYLKTH